MSEYKGITPEILFLAADNKFRDSRTFYEEHKEELKQGFIVPMRQIAGEVGSALAKLDPMMNLNPVKMVSRFRRDTRYAKDKSMYRDNVWIMFMRDKHSFYGYPCFWFEVTPENYSLGIGLFGYDAAIMQAFRRNMAADPDEFIKAAVRCEKTGASLFGENYKRMPAGCPKGLEDYYGKKDFGYIVYSSSLGDLRDETIIEIIKKYYKAFSPLYTLMRKAADEVYAKGE